MSGDGFAAVIVDRSPRIVRCLTSWGKATAVTIIGESDTGYCVAVASKHAGTCRTLREATTLAIQAHNSTTGTASDARSAPKRTGDGWKGAGKDLALGLAMIPAAILGLVVIPFVMRFVLGFIL